MIILKAMLVRERGVRNIHEKRLRNNQIRFLSISLISFLKTLSCQGFEKRIYCESMFFLIYYFHIY